MILTGLSIFLCIITLFCLGEIIYHYLYHPNPYYGCYDWTMVLIGIIGFWLIGSLIPIEKTKEMNELTITHMLNQKFDSVITIMSIVMVYICSMSWVMIYHNV